ncbi:MAG: M20/M25/M40 family metallo-hydrolase [Bacteroidia bacterium]|nr:M20/M25/M40 family metallo-hydrolase [Bacteroidia bacterium]
MRILLATAFLFAGFGAVAQTLPKTDADIKQSLEHNISYLADDRLEGRLVGSKGEKMAYEFIQENFQGMNLWAKGEQGFLQEFILKRITYKQASLVIQNKSGELKFDKIMKDRAFPYTQSGLGKVSGKCVWVGYGIESPQHNDYAQHKSVKGKIVVLKMGRPDPENPHSPLAAYASLEAKIDTAIKKGAEAIIVVNNQPDLLEPDFKPITKAPFKAVPIYFLGHQTRVDSNTFVNAKIELELDTVGVELKGHNVIGFINNKSEKTIVIGAHYDHLGYNELGGSTYRKTQNEAPQIHNGADDNASGTAVLIELAELLQKSPYRSQNYLFIAFSGEEEGLLGSRYFVEHPTIDLKKVNYMLNFDMVGRLDTSKNSFSISGTGTSPRWDSVLTKTTADGIHVKFDPSGTGASDHTSFYNEGMPVLHFFTGNHSDYHKPSDDWEAINFNGTLSVIKYVYGLIGKLDKQSKLAFTKTKETHQEGAKSFKVTLGIMPDYLYEGKGVKVDGVTDGRPAALAGVKRGDILTKLGSIELSDMQVYMKALGSFEKGQTVPLELKRGNETLKLNLTF